MPSRVDWIEVRMHGHRSYTHALAVGSLMKVQSFRCGAVSGEGFTQHQEAKGSVSVFRRGLPSLSHIPFRAGTLTGAYRG